LGLFLLDGAIPYFCFSCLFLGGLLSFQACCFDTDAVSFYFAFFFVRVSRPLFDALVVLFLSFPPKLEGCCGFVFPFLNALFCLLGFFSESHFPRVCFFGMVRSLNPLCTGRASPPVNFASFHFAVQFDFFGPFCCLGLEEVSVYCEFYSHAS